MEILSREAPENIRDGGVIVNLGNFSLVYLKYQVETPFIEGCIMFLRFSSLFVWLSMPSIPTPFPFFFGIDMPYVYSLSSS